MRNAVPEPIHEGWEAVVSEIVFEPTLLAALEGIEEFSHVVVLFWIDGVPDWRRRQLQIRPRDREDLPLVGVFATRSQYRPNPIGVSTVAVVERRENVLVVKGLDAIDGTPVLDVKPFMSKRDVPLDSRVPEWVEKLHGTPR